MTFYKLLNVIKQDMCKPPKFFFMSQSSNELIIQVMVIARNMRLAERFLALL